MSAKKNSSKCFCGCPKGRLGQHELWPVEPLAELQKQKETQSYVIASRVEPESPAHALCEGCYED